MSQSPMAGKSETPALMAQHSNWLAARSRLWAGAPPKTAPVPDRADEPVPEPVVPWGAPINLLDLPSPRFIIRLVALRRGVRTIEMKGPARTREVVAARDEAIGLIWTHCRQLSLPTVGRLFDRDHTTILHTLRKQHLQGDHFYRRRRQGAK